MARPCEKSLDAECFKAYPEWARQAFAWRLLHLMFPGEITKLLPPSLAFPPLPPGFEWPPNIIIPPGTEIPPWWVLPEGWQPGDLFPPDSTIPLDIDVPLWWLYSLIFPPGTIIPPGFTFPPGWQPGDPWPPGLILPPDLPPWWIGTFPPTFLDPGSGGTRPRTTPPAVPLVEYEITIPGTDIDGSVRNSGSADSWSEVHDATVGNNRIINSTWEARAIRVWYTSNKSTAIYRSFFTFFLTDIPSDATITAATFKLSGYSNSTSPVCVQQSSYPADLVLEDYNNFSGPSFSELVLPSSLSYLLWPLNSFGVSYLQSLVGGVNAAQFCVRDYTYDFANIPPTPGFPTIEVALLYQEYFAPLSRPLLDVTYLAE